MDLRKMIAELQAEKQRLDEAIVALERLLAGKVRARVKHDDAPTSPGEGDQHDDVDDTAETSGGDFPQGSIGPN